MITRILALDIGDKRIGVALSDPGEVLSSPLTIISRSHGEPDIAAIVDLVHRNSVGKIVVGLPRSLDGSLGTQAKAVGAFAQELAGRVEVPVEFRDERLTTVSARRLMRAARAGRRRRGEKDDAVAAAIILQGYLDETR